jgi:trimeric autotransporter adhesin
VIEQGPSVLLKLSYLRRSFIMFTGRKLALTLAFTAFVAVAFGASCRGFFQPNSLVSVAVQPPSPNVILGQTTTLQAWGTYQDNSRSQITSGVAWSSDTPTVLSIDETSGVATGASLGTATVTASSQGVSGTATATVYLVVTSLTVLPNTWSFSGAAGGTNPTGFVVTANGNQDVTTSAIFTSSNPSFISCVNGTDPVFCTAIAGTTPGPYTITVTYPETTLTATINVTAN